MKSMPLGEVFAIFSLLQLSACIATESKEKESSGDFHVHCATNNEQHQKRGAHVGPHMTVIGRVAKTYFVVESPAQNSTSYPTEDGKAVKPETWEAYATVAAEKNDGGENELSICQIGPDGVFVVIVPIPEDGDWDVHVGVCQHGPSADCRLVQLMKPSNMKNAALADGMVGKNRCWSSAQFKEEKGKDVEYEILLNFHACGAEDELLGSYSKGLEEQGSNEVKKLAEKTPAAKKRLRRDVKSAKNGEDIGGLDLASDLGQLEKKEDESKDWDENSEGDFQDGQADDHDQAARRLHEWMARRNLKDGWNERGMEERRVGAKRWYPQGTEDDESMKMWAQKGKNGIDRRRWEKSGMSWMKRNEGEEQFGGDWDKRRWEKSGMSWMKRSDEDGKRRWEKSGMAWMKRRPDFVEEGGVREGLARRRWEKSGMAWMKRANGREKK